MATSEKLRTAASDSKGGDEDRVQTTWGNEMGVVQKARLKKCFELFDVNKDGKISAAELRNLLTKMGNQDTRTFSEEQAQEVGMSSATHLPFLLAILIFCCSWQASCFSSHLCLSTGWQPH